jgi:hypothetical protein
MNINGKSENETIFNFNSSWDNHVPFRIAIYAENKRAILAPIEKCEMFDGKNTWEIIADKNDIDFKPGFYAQAAKFISLDFEDYNLESATNSMKLADHLFHQFD